MQNQSERAALKQYADVIGLWCSRFDTAEIAERTGLAEHLVAKWVANFRDQTRAIPASNMRAAA